MPYHPFLHIRESLGEDFQSCGYIGDKVIGCGRGEISFAVCCAAVVHAQHGIAVPREVFGYDFEWLVTENFFIAVLRTASCGHYNGCAGMTVGRCGQGSGKGD